MHRQIQLEELKNRDIGWPCTFHKQARMYELIYGDTEPIDTSVDTEVSFHPGGTRVAGDSYTYMEYIYIEQIPHSSNIIIKRLPPSQNRDHQRYHLTTSKTSLSK